MDSLCDNFWNSTISWDTPDPHLSPCFHKTVLVWIPTFFLWLFAPLEIYYLLSSKDRHVPWSWLNIMKIIFSIALVIEELLLLFYNIHGGESNDVTVADYVASSLLFISFLLQLVFILLEKKNGFQRSGYLFLFWFLVLICGLPGYISHITYVLDGDGESDSGRFIFFMIYYPMVIVMTALNCFVDKRPTLLFHPRGEKSSPELDASFPNHLTFAWLTSLIWKGYRNPLVQDDLWDLSYECSSKKIVKDWDRSWKKGIEKIYKKDKLNSKAGSPTKAKSSSSSDAKADTEEPSVFPALVRTFGAEFFFGACLKFCNDMMLFVSPIILNLLINFIEDPDSYIWRGYLYSVALFASKQLESFILSQYFYKMFAVGLKVRTAIISAVYRKSLRISNAARKEFTSGEIVNLMSVDAQRFMDLIPYLNMVWSAPLQVLLAMTFLWGILGPSVLSGFLVIVLLIPINGFIANRMKGYQMIQMKEKDNRVKLMNEILNGIKVLKLYAWEPSFEEQVVEIRKREVKVLKKSAYLSAVTAFIWTSTPFLMTFFMFLTYVMTGDDHVLTPDKVFVSIALLNIMRMPLNILPFLIIAIVQAKVSLKRMNKFLNAEELDPDAVSKEPPENLKGSPIRIEGGTFSWGKEDDPILKGINLNIKEGSLVAVVGAVGMGKSSLCSAILGEMEKISGAVTISNSVSYVPQQAWIQNSTLENNILFGCKKDNVFYKQVIDACALRDDLSILPGGDQTEIGEKGINLSGGQKQRVSLARAVYGNSDVHLLDDPLSAVDAHVGKHIFEMVIGPQGLLKKKTRLLITHSIIYLPKMDNIIVMKDGKITDQGTYQELLAKEGEFRDFLLEHLSKGEETTEEQDEFIDSVTELQKTSGHPKFERQISKISKSSQDGQSNDILRRRDSRISNMSSQKLEKGVVHTKKDAIGKNLIETEAAETGRVSYNVYGYYIKTIGVLATILTVVFYATAQACMVAANITLTIWSEDEDSDQDEVRNKYLAIYGSFGVGQSLLVLIALLGFARAAVRGSKWLHNNMLTNILHLPLTFFDITPLGRILNRFSKDMDIVDMLLPMNFRSLIQISIVVIATLAVIVYITPMFIVVLVPTLVIYYIVQLLYVTSSRQMKRIESVTRSPIYSHFGETIQGAATIRAYNKNQAFIMDSEKKVDYNQVSYYPSIIANRWLALRLEFLGNILTFFSALMAVLQKDNINAGQAGLSITYALSVTILLNWLVRTTSMVETNIVCVERVKEYTENSREAAWDIPSHKPPKSWPESGSIKFDKYSTRYREGLDLVVKNINCEVKPKEKIGIVGRTGAGKSSLTLALFRLIEPAEGDIYIDDVNITSIGLHDLRGKLTIIPQDPVLFSGNLRMNLDPFNRYEDENLWNALEQAHLKEFVSSLSAGLQHTISEGGENLSVGQRQLVCLARALLRKTKVLILDEATAAVDLETDDLIQQTIRREFADCTVLTIAHRLNTIMDSTRILVLDNGRIKEFDVPAELLRDKTSIFYGMAKDAGLV